MRIIVLISYFFNIYSMIEINNLEILPCNKGIYINCKIPNLEYYKDIYLDKIIIDSQDTYKYSNPSDSPIYQKEILENTKELQIFIPIQELLIDSTYGKIFFIYINVKGEFAPNTPCGKDTKINLFTIAEYTYIYKRSLQYIKDFQRECNVQKQFIDFILKYKFLQLLLKSKQYDLAIKYWNKLNNNVNKNIYNIYSCNV